MIDPNVWVSGLINPYGTPARVVQTVMDRQVIAIVTQHLLDELAAVLARPKFRRWIALTDAYTFLEALRGESALYPEPEIVPRRVRDPDDAYLVELSEAFGAVIVTGDSGLLEADITPPAITPRDLLKRQTRKCRGRRTLPQGCPTTARASTCTAPSSRSWC